MSNNPFQQKGSRIKAKTRGDREYRGGRKYQRNKSGLHEQVWELAGGRCEYEKVRGKPHHPECPRIVSLKDMHLAHKVHGHGFRDDSVDGTFCASAACHKFNDHGAAKYPRRPGKIMKISDARVYWEGNSCWCDGNKREKTSFCPECTQKLNPQTAYTLENADDQEAYREALAQAEIEVLMYGK